jgi:hypothetical protein
MEEFDNQVNAHLTKMADAGWELVTTTSTTSDGTTQWVHFIWKRSR